MKCTVYQKYNNSHKAAETMIVRNKEQAKERNGQKCKTENERKVVKSVGLLQGKEKTVEDGLSWE